MLASLAATFCLLLTAVHAFHMHALGGGLRGRGKLSMGVEDTFTSLNVAELFSSPTARYNGELISPSVKVVPVAPKPDNYKYGEVSGDATPALIAGSVLVVALAALVPGFLSAGESAKKQQGEFEVKNKIGVNEFAIKARQEKNKNAPEVKAAPKKK